ncbi:glycoside hydrolase family 15 protein [Lutibacter sp. B1]|uniref:glycoside hydrolase family 15 protein n=1 Tax=Lutibacter sp. B1 TaxID=2725996 RepID=UPI00145695E2|nr:glycoside hydrolase family 15 protein [Lutibacter sp. B1]NLP58308.1 glycoside hydrolase family 15 protein [Lutibacter sp. B1]
MTNLNYGIIGNCRSAALISESGSIDWCCLPDFNSSSVFAKILDKEIGGSFEIIVSDEYTTKQFYIKSTNILCTRFSNGIDAFEVFDFMPRYQKEDMGYYNPPDIIRYFKYISGKPILSVNYNPKLEYALPETESIIKPDYIKSFTKNGEYDSLYLYTSLDKNNIQNKTQFFLEDDAFMLLSYNQKLLEQTVERQYLKLQRTKVYWLNWSNKTNITSKYTNDIIRSALTLKILSYDKTGAVLAAATTSLPETIGEERNWDYRFCWIRDASMVIKVMSQLGHQHNVKRFMNFIIDIIPDKNEKIQIMYGINKEKQLTEETLSHLKGYENSAPVRIGNAAYIQKQNDIYGILVDVIYQQFKNFETSLDNSESLWTITRNIVKIVEDNWEKPDKGIWEIRTDEKHFTFSKVLCWVAIDRAIKIAKILRIKEYIEMWQPLADKIKNDIYQNAWNENVNAFTQFYGSNDLDAANLLMETYGFIDATDEKFVNTVLATERELCEDGLMYRYKNKDDFGLPSSSFTICTFWLINSLNAIGKRKMAKSMFEKLLSYSNHVGLFSEDIDFKTKRLLGNFPQAYSHLALIETAINLSKDDYISEDGKILDAIH